MLTDLISNAAPHVCYSIDLHHAVCFLIRPDTDLIILGYVECIWKWNWTENHLKYSRGNQVHLQTIVNAIVTFRGEGVRVEHTTFQFGTIGSENGSFIEE